MGSNYFDIQASSRPRIYQVVQITAPTIMASAAFSRGTQQIRVASQINGWGSIEQATSTAGTALTTAGGTGMLITGGSTEGPVTAYANIVPEYFTVTPGQFFLFFTTSSSTGALTVTEMT